MHLFMMHQSLSILDVKLRLTRFSANNKEVSCCTHYFRIISNWVKTEECHKCEYAWQFKDRHFINEVYLLTCCISSWILLRILLLKLLMKIGLVSSVVSTSVLLSTALLLLIRTPWSRILCGNKIDIVAGVDLTIIRSISNKYSARFRFTGLYL